MSIVDRERLLDYLEGDLEFLDDSFEIFCQDSESLLGELRQAFADRDLGSVHKHAHTFKGMLSNFHADSACQTVKQIEEIEIHELPTTTILEQLAKQIETIKSEIHQILQTGER